MDLIFAGKALCTPISSPGRCLGNYLFFVYGFQHVLQASARQKWDGRACLSRVSPPPRQHRCFRRPRTVPSPLPPPPDTQRPLLCPSDRSLNSQPGLAHLLPTPPQLGGAQVPVADLWGVAQPPRSGCSRATPSPPPHCRGAASPAGAPAVWAFSALFPCPFCLCQFCGSRARRRRGGCCLDPLRRRGCLCGARVDRRARGGRLASGILLARAFPRCPWMPLRLPLLSLLSPVLPLSPLSFLSPRSPRPPWPPPPLLLLVRLPSPVGLSPVLGSRIRLTAPAPLCGCGGGGGTSKAPGDLWSKRVLVATLPAEALTAAAAGIP